MKPVAETKQDRYNYQRIFVKHGPPQGMTEAQFQQVSDRLRRRLKEEAARTGDFGDDLFVHGSRGKGTAEPGADLDIGVRVAAGRFDQLIRERAARVRRGSDKWETLQEAVRQGRLHSGEAGISGVRKEIQRLINEEMNLGFAKGVQVTVIREAGPFDQGPFIPLRPATT
jgi:hypothetical protein